MEATSNGCLIELALDLEDPIRAPGGHEPRLGGLRRRPADRIGPVRGHRSGGPPVRSPWVKVAQGDPGLTRADLRRKGPRRRARRVQIFRKRSRKEPRGPGGGPYHRRMERDPGGVGTAEARRFPWGLAPAKRKRGDQRFSYARAWGLAPPPSVRGETRGFPTQGRRGVVERLRPPPCQRQGGLRSSSEASRPAWAVTPPGGSSALASNG